MTTKIDETVARKVLEVVDAGLVHGVGKPIPGQMCVEAAVCFALGLPHGDEPNCVSPALRALKIALNDAAWSSDRARTRGLRKLAILQLGTDADFDEQEFVRRVVVFNANTILADTYAELAVTFSKLKKMETHVSALNEASAALRAVQDISAAASAADSARSAADSAYSAANSAYSAANSAYSAAYSAYSAAYSAADSARSAAYSAYSAADSAANSARSAAASAANSAYSAANSAADSAANSAYSAAYSANSAAASARDRVLCAFAEGVAQILIAMGVQGAKWLGLLN